MGPVRRPSPFLEQVRAAIRVRHYSIRTEESYLFWVRRFILFHGKRHPRELGESQVGEFLTHLAVDRRVSASTQNQALNALVFLYKAVLERPLGDIGGVVRARGPQRLPVVLHVREVKALLRHLEGSHWLAACLMYGSGLRLMEALAKIPASRTAMGLAVCVPGRQAQHRSSLPQGTASSHRRERGARP
jgi:site-specific recombinase XerD